MLEVKNPFVLSYKVLSRDSGKADTGRGVIQAAQPSIELQFFELEVEELESKEEKLKFLEKEVKVIFEDYSLTLKDTDEEIFLNGEGIAEIKEVEMKEDSVVLTVDLVLDF